LHLKAKLSFETGFFHFIMVSSVETRRFQAMGHNWIQLVQPPPPPFSSTTPVRMTVVLGVFAFDAASSHWTHSLARKSLPGRKAAQVDPFESNGLKPGYHISQVQGLGD
jgi:hypothetical protein